MAWYRNFYNCTDCGTSWEDEWSCCCDDECPECGSGDWSPYESEDLTEVIEQRGEEFAVLRSPEDADDRPSYSVIAKFTSRALAERFVREGELT